MIDREELRRYLLAEYDVRIGEDDPLLIAMMVHQVILDAYTEVWEKSIRESLAEFDAQIGKQLAEGREDLEKTHDLLLQSTRDLFDENQKRLEKAQASMSLEYDDFTTRANRIHRTMLTLCALTVAACLGTALIILAA